MHEEPRRGTGHTFDASVCPQTLLDHHKYKTLEANPPPPPNEWWLPSPVRWCGVSLAFECSLVLQMQSFPRSTLGLDQEKQWVPRQDILEVWPGRQQTVVARTPGGERRALPPWLTAPHKAVPHSAGAVASPLAAEPRNVFVQGAGRSATGRGLLCGPAGASM